MKLTLPQQDIYFEQFLYPGEPIYNIGAKIEITGFLDSIVLEQAYVALINQHDAYRSIFKRNQDDVEIEIDDACRNSLEYLDLSGTPDAVHTAEEYMRFAFSKTFDLESRQPLFRFILIKAGTDFHFLFSVYHHIITDGWGTSLMFQRLVKNYNEILELGDITSTYPFSYRSFVAEDLAYQHSDMLENDRQYWLKQFESLPENLLDRKDKNNHGILSERKELTLKRPLYDQLNGLAQVYNTSTFHLILACIYIYFSKKYQQNDLAVGLPVLNRTNAVHKKTVGLFMGVSPLRMKIDFGWTLAELLAEIKGQLRKDYRHQKYPLSKLVQDLRLFKEKERLFNITLSYEKQDYSYNFMDTSTRVIPLSNLSERVALAIYIREFDAREDVKLDFDYNVNYFNASEITEVTSHFEHLVGEMLRMPERRIHEFSYMDSTDINQQRWEFNNTVSIYPADKTVIDLFREQVMSSHEKIALRDGTADYSYQDLDVLTDKVANYLDKRLGPENRLPVALLLQRNADMIITILGVLKSGRPYIPLDPLFPIERLNFIMSNSMAPVAISDGTVVLHDAEIIHLQDMMNDMHAIDTRSCFSVSPADTAYIIYTSGSTGNPKGVEIGHRALTNLLTSMRNHPGVASAETFFSVTTYSFDISILEFFTPLIAGATLFIATQDVLEEPANIIATLYDLQPQIIQSTPGFYQMLFNAGWTGSKKMKILCGGDLLGEDLAEKLLQSCGELWNMYGPTETTIWSSCKKIMHPSEAANIGKPINNTRCYILDNFMELMPVGAIGAIYIGGDGLSKGYYKNEWLTGEKFKPDPFDSSKLIYETGDLGRWNKKGEIEFLGRADHQVKIRGFRIEPGEIERRVLLFNEEIEQVVVVAKEHNNEKVLVTYWTTHSTIDKASLRIFLLRSLPEYMVPNYYIELKRFQLTPNGKIDRKALPEIREEDRILNTYVKPGNKTESIITEVWQEIFNNGQIGVADDFFELGGHSLTAIKLVNILKERLAIRLEVKDIFNNSNISSLATHIASLEQIQGPAIPLITTTAAYCLTPAQTMIWIASQQTDASIAYNMSAAYQVHGPLQSKKIGKILREMVSHHNILRTNFIEENGIPKQVVRPYEQIEHLVHVKEIKNVTNIDATLNDLTTQLFDFENDILLKVYDLEFAATQQRTIVFVTHHIIMDGLSIDILINKITQLYKQESYCIEPVSTQFGDYAVWLNKRMDLDNQDSAYWSEGLAGYTPKDIFIKDYTPLQKSFHGRKYILDIPGELTILIENLAREKNVTAFTIITAIFTILAYRYSGHTDIGIGTVHSGREHPDTMNMLGMFAKTTILRIQLNPDATFPDLLMSTQKTLLEINKRHDIPLDHIPALNQCLDVLLVYQHPVTDFEEISFSENTTLKRYPATDLYCRTSVVFNFCKTSKRLFCEIDYNKSKYKSSTIATIAENFVLILRQILQDKIYGFNTLEITKETKNTLNSDIKFNF